MKVEAYDSVVSQLFYALICNILYPMPILCSRQVFLHLAPILELKNYRQTTKSRVGAYSSGGWLRRPTTAALRASKTTL